MHFFGFVQKTEAEALAGIFGGWAGIFGRWADFLRCIIAHQEPLSGTVSDQHSW